MALDMSQKVLQFYVEEELYILCPCEELFGKEIEKLLSKVIWQALAKSNVNATYE